MLTWPTLWSSTLGHEWLKSFVRRSFDPYQASDLRVDASAPTGGIYKLSVRVTRSDHLGSYPRARLVPVGE